MSTVKIEHVNPNSGRSIAFDIMSGDEVKDTFVLRHGEFRIFNLSGGLMLHEVSMAELAERERKAAEVAELEAEVARERKAKEEHEHAEKVKAERDAKKAEIEAKANEGEEPGVNALGEPFHGKPEDAKTYEELGHPEPEPVYHDEPHADPVV
jgi:hypothetical protein